MGTISQEKVNQAHMECYRRMFNEAEPSANINKIVKSGEGKKPSFFMGYYLHQDRQYEIIDEVLKKLKIPNHSINSLKSGIILGSCPSGNKESTIKFREEMNNALSTENEQ